MLCLASLIFNFYLHDLELLLDHLDGYAWPERMKNMNTHCWLCIIRMSWTRILIYVSYPSPYLSHRVPFNIIKFCMQINLERNVLFNLTQLSLKRATQTQFSSTNWPQVRHENISCCSGFQRGLFLFLKAEKKKMSKIYLIRV